MLLRAFYERAFADPLLGHVFLDVAGLDLEAHLPVIADFWEKVLLGTGSYSGRVMAVHRVVHTNVALTSDHFTRWLELWRETLDVHFVGPVAVRTGGHARHLAAVFLRDLAAPPARSLHLISP